MDDDFGVYAGLNHESRRCINVALASKVITPQPHMMRFATV
jgi:hypothetical protein